MASWPSEFVEPDYIRGDHAHQYDNAAGNITKTSLSGIYDLYRNETKRDMQDLKSGLKSDTQHLTLELEQSRTRR